MEKRTTASEADLKLIITNLVNLIPELLLAGHTIKLDDFGTFRLHAKTLPSENPDKVTVRNIKELRISFIPDKRMKLVLKEAKITPE